MHFLTEFSSVSQPHPVRSGTRRLKAAEHQRNTSAVIKPRAYIPRRTASQVTDIDICLKRFRCQWSVDKLQHNCSRALFLWKAAPVWFSPPRLLFLQRCERVQVSLHIHVFSGLSVYCSSVASFCKSPVMKSCRSSVTSVTHFEWWLLSPNEVASKNRHLRFGFLPLRSSQTSFSGPRYKLCGVSLVLLAFTLYLNMDVNSQHTSLTRGFHLIIVM